MLSVKQAATQAGVSRSLIYALLRQGRLAAVRIGCRGKGKWRIEQSALDAFVEQCKAAAPPAALTTPLRHLR